ncbi:MAG: DUF2171 domain-containing protein [Thermomicrobiaceae bacterium]|nr:DUF2171 domain-containing protein [Thermomicrobiaceae bacterium]
MDEERQGQVPEEIVRDPEQLLNEVKHGMDVFDNSGEKVGTVDRVYRSAGVDATDVNASDVYLRVEGGFLGLGADLFIPWQLVGSVRPSGVWLNVGKDTLTDLSLDQRPFPIPD